MIYINGFIKESIVDGDGLRFVLFVQGCPHHCKGCHNPQTWNDTNGKWVLESDIITQISKNPLLDGITFSGGEPFYKNYTLHQKQIFHLVLLYDATP